MSPQFNVEATPRLDAMFRAWNVEDKRTLVSLLELLEEYGFDLIVNTAGKNADWLSVEFVEPGETPEMLWARAFVDLQKSSQVLRIFWEQGVIRVDSG